MSLQQMPIPVGHGGQGFPNPAGLIIASLATLQFTVVAGAAAAAKMSIADIREGDHIFGAVAFNAGTPAAVSDLTIVDTHAKGTVTLANAVPADGDYVTVRGVQYTFVATADDLAGLNYILIRETLNENAAALAAAINAYEGRWDGSKWIRPLVKASVNSAVVTIRATDEGTGPNAYTLARAFATSGNATVSGTNLSGGTTTGGVTSATNLTGQELMVVWCKVKTE